MGLERQVPSGMMKIAIHDGNIVIADPVSGVMVGVTADGKLKVATEIAFSGDIQVGAVEIKDGATNVRSSVTTRGSKGALGVEVLDNNGIQITQFGANPVGISGDVAIATVKPDGTNTMPSMDAVDRAGFIKITDGVQTVEVFDAGADAVSNALDGLLTECYLYGYNGTNWDRLRSINTGQLKVTTYSSGGTEGTKLTDGTNTLSLYANADVATGNRGVMMYSQEIAGTTTRSVRSQVMSGTAIPVADYGLVGINALYGWNGTAFSKLFSVNGGQQLRITAYDAAGVAVPIGDLVTTAPFHKITDGVETLSIDTNGYAEVSVRGFPTNGITVKNPTGTPIYTRPFDGTNSGPVGDAASRAIFTTEAHYTYAHVTADAQVKAALGRLHTVTVNSCTSGDTLTLYDSLTETGNIIAAIGLDTDTNTPMTLTYDCAFGTGLYVGFGAGLVADITLSYI